jgi:RNA recognition motif-containing protein
MTTDDDASAAEEHYFHSPLNSNAVLSIVLTDVIPLADLKSRYLSQHSNYEVLSFHDSIIKIRFFNKSEAQSLADELLNFNEEIDVKLHFDTLTHPGNIYVRGLVPEVTTQDLYEIFEPFGEITSCKICFDEFGQSKGYGFINFKDGHSADTAIEKLNGLLINGSKFYLNHHIAKKERIERVLFEKQNFTNLYVKNIPNSYDEPKITELFEKFGEINSLFLPDVDTQSINHNSAQPQKKFGFINYKNHDSAVEAILNLDNKELEPGAFLSVSRAQRRDERKSPLGILPTLNIPSNIIPSLLPPHPSASPVQHRASYSSPSSFVPIVATGSSQTRSSFSSPSPGPAFQFTDPTGLPLPGPHQQQSNLYVKNLSQNITDDKLNSIFAQFGSIVSAKIMTLEDGITSRGFGFVCFKSVQEASGAMVAMNGSVIDGEVVHVSFAQKNNKKLGKAQYKAHQGGGGIGNSNNNIPPYYYPGINYGGPNPGNNGVSYYYGIPQPSPVHPQYEYIPHGQKFNNNAYKPSLRKRQQQYVSQEGEQLQQTHNLNGNGNGNGHGKREPFELAQAVSELSTKISTLDSKEAKFDSVLRELINPSYIQFKESETENSDIKPAELATDDIEKITIDFLEGLVKRYDFKYDELLNDLSNEELELAKEFGKLSVLST